MSIGIKLDKLSSASSPYRSTFFVNLFIICSLNFSVSASANSGIGSGNLYSAALRTNFSPSISAGRGKAGLKTSGLDPV
uniref:Uncharacterized protein n=1 Tax=Kalanchoe fedtschenkoi TaxID=63787 RepID=A0A7N0VM00_KALFE